MNEAPADNSLSLHSVFFSPARRSSAESYAQWRTFQDKLSGELRSVKTASMPDLMPKIGELFDIRIPDILLTCWRKTIEVRNILDKSRAAPDATFWTGLGEHTISSEHHPYVDVKIKGQTVKRVELTIRILFKLNSFVLKIKQGQIREIQSGTCEIRGVVEYQGVMIAERKLEPIQLPGVLPVD